MDSEEQTPASAAEDGAPDSSVRSVPGPWMLVVAALAVAGAGALYMQLLDIGQTDPISPAPLTSVPTKLPTPTATFHSRTVPTATASQAAQGKGGHGGAASADGGGAAHGGANTGGQGGKNRVPVPAPSSSAVANAADAPEGMVFVPWPQPNGSNDTPAASSAQAPTSSPPGFFIDRTEVATSAYRRCVLAGRCVPAKRVVLTEGAITMLAAASAKNQGEASPEQLARAWENRCNEARDATKHPANCVNFASARDYCRYTGSRLPSAREWLRAAQLDTSRRFAWGDEQPSCGFACFGRNGSCLGGPRKLTSCPVGSHKRDRSAAGLLDMSGNVAEWVRDKEKQAGGQHSPAPRLIMGGSFSDELAQITLATRRALPPVTAHVNIGFRCARDTAKSDNAPSSNTP